MGMTVSPDFQKAAAEALAVATSVIEGVDAEVAERSSGTNPRHVVAVSYTHLTLPTIYSL